MNNPSRPILRWHGSKWRIAPWVISHFPKHTVYVEPFGGAAGVLLRKGRAVTEVYNDLDAELVNMFRVIRETPSELARALMLTPYARDEYQSLYQSTDDVLERARRFISRSFMGMQSKGAIKKSGFDARTNPGGYTGRLRSFADTPEEVVAVAGRFTHVLIENCEALDLVSRYDRPDALIYVDPPYLAETRSGKIYNHEMTDRQHSALLERLRSLSSMVIISGYPSELYDAALSDWARHTLRAHTDGGTERLEVLWINPKAAQALRRDEGCRSLPLFPGMEAYE